MSDNIFYLYSDSRGRKFTSNNLPKIIEKADDVISTEMFDLSLKSGPTVRYEIITERQDNKITKSICGKELNSLGSFYQPEFSFTIEHVNTL